MNQLKLAIVGLGAIGLEHLAIYRSMPNVQITAIVDSNQSIAQKIAGELQSKSFESVSQLLSSDTAFDAVSLCTPDHLHVDDTFQLIDNGKHVLVEKPIATTFDDAVRLAKASDSSSVVVMPGHTLRFEPRYHGAHRLVADGTIGEVLYGYVRRDNHMAVAERANGRVSVAWFLGIHDIDAVMWVTGQAVKEVQAMQSEARDASGKQSVAVMANLRLDSGNVVQLEAAWGLPETYPTELDSQLRLVGTHGYVAVENFDSGVRLASESRFDLPMTAGAPMYSRSQGALSEELKVFVSACQTGQAVPITMQEAARAVGVVCAIEESLNSGGVVEVPLA